jgi:hypothetical protein
MLTCRFADRSRDLGFGDKAAKGGPSLDGFVHDHIPATCDGSDIDAWSHIGPQGTHVAMVIEYPESKLVQGAEEYLQPVATRSDVGREVAQRVHGRTGGVGRMGGS